MLPGSARVVFLRERSGKGTLEIVGRGQEARKEDRSDICSRDDEYGSRILEEAVCATNNHGFRASSLVSYPGSVACTHGEQNWRLKSELHKRQSRDRLVASSVHASQAQEWNSIIKNTYQTHCRSASNSIINRILRSFYGFYYVEICSESRYHLPVGCVVAPCCFATALDLTRADYLNGL